MEKRASPSGFSPAPPFRTLHTRYEKDGSHAEFKTILKNGLVVSIEGDNMGVKDLQGLLSQVDLNGLEGLAPHIPPNSALSFDLTLLGFRARSPWVKPLIQDNNTHEKPYHADLKIYMEVGVTVLV